jgi:TPR repeat protein
MHGRFWLWLALAAICPPAFAADPTFAELLAKAEAQYDAGHRWSPPGDNMVETVATMMERISTASPQQLAELSTLLAKGAAQSGDPLKPESPAAAPPATPPPTTSPKPPPELSPQASVPPPEPSPQAAAPPEPSPQTAAPPEPSPQAAAPPKPSPQPTAPPKPPPQASAPPKPSPQTSAPPKPSPQTTARAADLLARGKEAEALGNFSGARRLYASAASLGNAAAALSLGRLYDPAFLKQTAMGGIESDPALARHWYQRAVALGDSEAGRLLEALSGR